MLERPEKHMPRMNMNIPRTTQQQVNNEKIMYFFESHHSYLIS